MAANISMTDVPTSLTEVLTHPVTFGVRTLFYLTLPSETSFPKVEQVPPYVDQVNGGILFYYVKGHTIGPKLHVPSICKVWKVVPPV